MKQFKPDAMRICISSVMT